jgi:hypothetical protein
MYSKISIIITVTLVTAAFLIVQSSMLPLSYAQSRLDATTQNTILTMHNDARRAVGVPQATWSDSLARDAQAWADYIVSLNLRWDLCGSAQDPQFTQCPPHATWQQRNSQGENLAWGYNRPLTTLAKSWIDEAPNCPPGCVIPADGSLGVYPRQFGHYTQIVWNTATQVGCGIAQQPMGGNTWDMLVCRYLQAGNYPNQAPYGPGAVGAAAAVGEEQNTLGDAGGAAAVGEEQNTLGDQAVVQ